MEKEWKAIENQGQKQIFGIGKIQKIIFRHKSKISCLLNFRRFFKWKISIKKIVEIENDLIYKTGN